VAAIVTVRISSVAIVTRPLFIVVFVFGLSLVLAGNVPNEIQPFPAASAPSYRAPAVAVDDPPGRPIGTPELGPPYFFFLRLGRKLSCMSRGLRQGEHRRQNDDQI
jgi:hypothetical protein